MRLGSYWLVPKREIFHLEKNNNNNNNKMKTDYILKFLYSLYSSNTIARRPELYSTARVTADDSINDIRVRSRHRRHSRHTIRPERYNLFPRRGNHIQRPLHIPHRKMRHVIHIQTPLRSQDRQPSPRLAIMSHNPARLETMVMEMTIDEGGRVDSEYTEIIVIARGENPSAPWIPVRAAA